MRWSWTIVDLGLYRVSCAASDSTPDSLTLLALHKDCQRWQIESSHDFRVGRCKKKKNVTTYTFTRTHRLANLGGALIICMILEIYGNLSISMYTYLSVCMPLRLFASTGRHPREMDLDCRGGRRATSANRYGTDPRRRWNAHLIHSLRLGFRGKVFPSLDICQNSWTTVSDHHVAQGPKMVHTNPQKGWLTEE